VGSENGHRLRQTLADRCDLVALNRSGAHFREHAAPFPRRLICATATAQSDHADAEAARYYSWDERERLKPGV